MKLVLAFIGGVIIASFGFVWYHADRTGDILAFLQNHEAHIGKTVYLPLK